MLLGYDQSKILGTPRDAFIRFMVFWVLRTWWIWGRWDLEIVNIQCFHWNISGFLHQVFTEGYGTDAIGLWTVPSTSYKISYKIIKNFSLKVRKILRDNKETILMRTNWSELKLIEYLHSYFIYTKLFFNTLATPDLSRVKTLNCVIGLKLCAFLQKESTR